MLILVSLICLLYYVHIDLISGLVCIWALPIACHVNTEHELKYIHTEKVVNSYNEVHTYSIVITLHAVGYGICLHTDPV